MNADKLRALAARPAVMDEDAREAFRRVAGTPDGKLVLDWIVKRYLLTPVPHKDQDESALRLHLELRNLTLVLLQVIEQRERAVSKSPGEPAGEPTGVSPGKPARVTARGRRRFTAS